MALQASIQLFPHSTMDNFFARSLYLHLEKVEAMEGNSNLPSVLNIHIVRLNDLMHKSGKWKAAISECGVFEGIV